MLKYLQHALQLGNNFKKFEVTHIPREENTRANMLARLANTKGQRLNKMVIQETLEAPIIEVEKVMVLENVKGCMTPII